MTICIPILYESDSGEFLIYFKKLNLIRIKNMKFMPTRFERAEIFSESPFKKFQE
jgi:hypothetical protein